MKWRKREGWGGVGGREKMTNELQPLAAPAVNLQRSNPQTICKALHKKRPYPKL